MPIHTPSVNNKEYSTFIIEAACPRGSARGTEKIRGHSFSKQWTPKEIQGLFRL
jgi:hypothetical protein